MSEPRKGTKAQLQEELDLANNNLRQMLVQNSYLTRRAALARGLGQSFEGDRDLYQVLGYPKDPDFEVYLNYYERDGIAKRIVDAVSDETWRERPKLVEGDDDVKVDELDEQGPLQKEFSQIADQVDLWSGFNEVDASCGISRFGLLFLGLPGNLDEPAEKGPLAYVTVHDEGNSEVDETTIVRDAESERFGLPEFYYIVVDEKTMAKKRVHYSRVIHVKEGRSRRDLGRVYGVPRLQSMLNRLMDLEKVTGGGSEAFWLLIHRGMALTAKEGMSLPEEGTTAYNSMVDEIEEYQHGLRRIMRLVGLDVQDLGAQPVDSREQFDVLIAYLAGSSHIPQRILIGSEAGQLASSQDEFNFSGYIAARQKRFAETNILRPTIKRLGEMQLLNVPEKYFVSWPSLFQLTDLENASIASQIASAVNTITGGVPEIGMPVEVFFRRYLDYEPTKEDLAAIEEAKRKPDEANQNSPFGKNGKDGEVDLAGLLAKVPNKDDVKASLNVLLSRAGGVTGHWEEGGRVWSDDFGNTLFTWHNFEGGDQFSTMVALRVPEVLRRELKDKYPFIQDEDELHITLAYLGDIRTLSRMQIDMAVSEFAMVVKPLKIEMQGIARFVSGQDKDPIVVTFDSPGNELVELRRYLTEALTRNGIPYHDDHGYIPHMTLAYIDKDAPLPIDTIDRMEMNFASVFVVIGAIEYEIPLGVVSDAIPSAPPALQ